jgi:hypothetical protein
MRESKILMTDFIQEDRFDLNSYLSNLFARSKDMRPKQFRNNKITIKNKFRRKRPL